MQTQEKRGYVCFVYVYTVKNPPQTTLALLKQIN